MDQAFVDLFKAEGVLRPRSDANAEMVFRFINEETGEIEAEKVLSSGVLLSQERRGKMCYKKRYKLS